MNFDTKLNKRKYEKIQFFVARKIFSQQQAMKHNAILTMNSTLTNRNRGVTRIYGLTVKASVVQNSPLCSMQLCNIPNVAPIPLHSTHC